MLSDKESNKKTNLGLIIRLFATYFLYSVIGVISKVTSKYPVSIKFFMLLGLLLALMGLYAIIYQQLIKYVPLSMAYSLKGIVIIFNLLWAMIIFKEGVTIWNFIGSIIILTGIYIVGKNE